MKKIIIATLIGVSLLSSMPAFAVNDASSSEIQETYQAALEKEFRTYVGFYYEEVGKVPEHRSITYGDNIYVFWTEPSEESRDKMEIGEIKMKTYSLKNSEFTDFENGTINNDIEHFALVPFPIVYHDSLYIAWEEEDHFIPKPNGSGSSYISVGTVHLKKYDKDLNTWTDVDLDTSNFDFYKDYFLDSVELVDDAIQLNISVDDSDEIIALKYSDADSLLENNLTARVPAVAKTELSDIEIQEKYQAALEKEFRTYVGFYYEEFGKVPEHRSITYGDNIYVFWTEPSEESRDKMEIGEIKMKTYSLKNSEFTDFENGTINNDIEHFALVPFPIVYHDSLYIAWTEEDHLIPDPNGKASSYVSVGTVHLKKYDKDLNTWTDVDLDTSNFDFYKDYFLDSVELVDDAIQLNISVDDSDEIIALKYSDAE